MDTNANPHYITEHWKQEVKQVLDEGLYLRQDVTMWTADFPDGDILHVPTMGQLTTRDYTEGELIKTESTTSTDFQLQITEYKQAGIQITDKFKQDSAYVDLLTSKYKVEIVAAIMREFESAIAHLQAQQTASNPNLIDGADHRFVSKATDNVGGVIDFQLAALALSKSRAMTTAANAYISPDFVFELQQIANLLHQQIYGANRMLADGGLAGKLITAAQENRAVVGSVGGFTVYNHLLLDYALSESITATSATKFASGTVTAGAANLFVGREAFVGAMRTMPAINEFRDHKHLSDVIHATFRYGIDLYRPESLVVCLTDAS